MERDVAIGDGVSLHYAEAGSGDAVICLHGTGPGSSGLSSYAANIGAIGERFHTYVPDLPRFGGSTKVKITAPRLDYMSGAIRRFMDALGIERAHLVGNSMGAQTALKLAIDSPDRVGRLVLMAPAVMGYSLSLADADRGDAADLDVLLRRRAVPRADAAAAAAHGPRPAAGSPTRSSTSGSRRASTRRPSRRTRSARGHGRAWRVRSEKCAAPTLLIWGLEDRATPFDHALYLMKTLPGRPAARAPALRPLGERRAGRGVQRAGRRLPEPGLTPASKPSRRKQPWRPCWRSRARTQA